MAADAGTSATGTAERPLRQPVVVYDSPPPGLVRIGCTLLSLKATVALSGAAYFAWRELTRTMEEVRAASGAVDGQGSAIDWFALWSGSLPGVALPVSSMYKVGFLVVSRLTT
jgi:hypothetical protein